MSEPRESKRVPRLGRFRLDGWAVRQDEGTLCCEDRVVRLEPRMMDVLVYLAAEPGAVVSKEDLLEVVWGGSFIEEGALTQAIHSLRKALGDNARQSRFIQTIPKRGYRLVATVTPEGADPELSSLSQREKRWRDLLPVGIVLVVVAVILGLARARFNETHALRSPKRIRIVVLPFENLNEPQDASFAKGLTEEIRNNLISCPFLDVRSRTTTEPYAHKRPPEIAQELGVDYVLEGTVQLAVSVEGRPRVRIRSQLVRAADDTQVWADGFDREIDIEMKDLFAVESEISRKVIAHLVVFLFPKEKQAQSIARRDLKRLSRGTLLAPTAYQAYLRGQALQTFGFVLRRKGRFEEAAESLQRAYRLDPKSAILASEIADTYRAMRNYEEANRFYLQAISMAPDKSYYWEGRVLTRLSWTGDVTDARAVLKQTSATADPEILTVRFKVEFFARDYQQVISQLTSERLHALTLVDQYHLKTLAVIARERMGDRIGARVLAEANRAELQNLMKLDPKQPFYPAFLAVTLAELGQDAEALALAEKTARETKGDAYTGANFIELQAMVEAILGHRREAIGRLSHLLATSYDGAISVNDLRLDPVWDLLRGDPEFEILLRRYSG